MDFAVAVGPGRPRLTFHLEEGGGSGGEPGAGKEEGEGSGMLSR